eukprot:516712_1
MTEEELMAGIPPDLTVEENLDAQFNGLLKELNNHGDALVNWLQTAADSAKKALHDISEVDCKENTPGNDIKNMVLVFTANDGPHSGELWFLRPLMGEPCLVGRSSGRAFQERGVSLPKDLEVSTTHGKITQSGFGVYYYSDMNSTNGSKVDGEEANDGKDYMLKGGSVLAIGRTRLTVSLKINEK